MRSSALRRNKSSDGKDTLCQSVHSSNVTDNTWAVIGGRCMEDGAEGPRSGSLRIDEGLRSMVIGYMLSLKVYPSIASAYPVAHDGSPFTIEAYTSSKLVYAS